MCICMFIRRYKEHSSVHIMITRSLNYDINMFKHGAMLDVFIFSAEGILSDPVSEELTDNSNSLPPFKP